MIGTAEWRKYISTNLLFSISKVKFEHTQIFYYNLNYFKLEENLPQCLHIYAMTICNYVYI